MNNNDKLIEELKSQVLEDANSKTSWWPMLVIGLILLIVWIVNWCVGNSMENPSGFGDMFGASNALFSGFALAAVGYSLWLQRIELAQQRKVTLLSVLELAKSVEAQKGSEEALKAQIEVMKSQIKVMQDSSKIQASSAVYSAVVNMFTSNKTGYTLDMIKQWQEKLEDSIKAIEKES